MSCCCSVVLGRCQSIRNTDEESHSTTMTQLSIAPFISKKKKKNAKMSLIPQLSRALGKCMNGEVDSLT